MPHSELRFIKNFLAYEPKENISRVPRKTRGIYALYQYSKEEKTYELVYIGMARGERSGIRGRLEKHARSKQDLWTHYSAYEVWDNLHEEEIEELEGLLRHLFKHDPNANRLNKQKSYKKLGRLRSQTRKVWKKQEKRRQP
ncbi:MAG: hypothetical protein JNM55_13960 [Anaerolineales bacterium]|nr:hypothetical protein [Anaerolineales bacterium]